MNRFEAFALAITLFACGHTGPYTQPQAIHLSQDIVSIDMGGAEPSKKEFLLFKLASEACPTGFRMIEDDVDSHHGSLRGYFIVKCGPPVPCTPGQEFFGCRSSEPPATTP